MRDKIARLFRRLDKFLDLPADHQRRVIYTLLLVVAFRLALWVIPYRTLQRIADRVPARRIASDEEASQIAHDITAVSRYVLEATCLTQALVAQVLLQRDGFSPKMKIGVAHGENGQLKAHAWIEMDGRIFIGDLGPEMVFATMQKS